MDNGNKMQALDDELLEHVAGGRNFFEWLFGSWDANTEIAAPVPTAAKECCKSSNGLHKFDGAPGNRRCIYCNAQ